MHSFRKGWIDYKKNEATHAISYNCIYLFSSVVFLILLLILIYM